MDNEISEKLNEMRIRGYAIASKILEQIKTHEHLFKDNPERIISVIAAAVTSGELHGIVSTLERMCTHTDECKCAPIRVELMQIKEEIDAAAPLGVWSNPGLH